MAELHSVAKVRCRPSAREYRLDKFAYGIKSKIGYRAMQQIDMQVAVAHLRLAPGYWADRREQVIRICSHVPVP